MQDLISKGYITHIAGRNGAGKSTLLKKSCKYFIDNETSFSYVGHYHGLLEAQTAEDQIKFYKNLMGHDMSLWIDILDDISPKSYIFELSCGQKQRLSLACHLNFNSNVWVLDEPFDSLDQVASTLLQSAFIRFLSEDKSILLVDHSFDLKDSLHKYSKERYCR